MGLGMQFAWLAARDSAGDPADMPLPASPELGRAPRPAPTAFEDIVSLNIFSESQLPPRRRYVPPGQAGFEQLDAPRPRARPAAFPRGRG